MTQPGYGESHPNAPENREPQVAPPSDEESAATTGLGTVDDQSATPPHGDKVGEAPYDLDGDTGDASSPQSPSGT